MEKLISHRIGASLFTESRLCGFANEATPQQPEAVPPKVEGPTVNPEKPAAAAQERAEAAKKPAGSPNASTEAAKEGLPKKPEPPAVESKVDPKGNVTVKVEANSGVVAGGADGVAAGAGALKGETQTARAGNIEDLKRATAQNSPEASAVAGGAAGAAAGAEGLTLRPGTESLKDIAARNAAKSETESPTGAGETQSSAPADKPAEPDWGMIPERKADASLIRKTMMQEIGNMNKTYTGTNTIKIQQQFVDEQNVELRKMGFEATLGKNGTVTIDLLDKPGTQESAPQNSTETISSNGNLAQQVEAAKNKTEGANAEGAAGTEGATAEVGPDGKGKEKGGEKGQEFGGDKLEGHFKEFREAKTDAQRMAAAMKVLADILAMLKEFTGVGEEGKAAEAGGDKKGTDKKGGETKGEGKGAEGGGSASTPEGRAKEEINKKAEEKGDKSSEGVRNAAKETREEKMNKIQENNQEIVTLEQGIAEYKDKNKDLRNQQNDLEQQIDQLEDRRGDKSTDAKLLQLETQLEAINKTIQANKDAVKKLDVRHDDLVEQNAELRKEITAIEKIESGMDGIGKAVEQINALMKEYGMNMEFSVTTEGVSVKNPSEALIKATGAKVQKDGSILLNAELVRSYLEGLIAGGKDKTTAEEKPADKGGSETVKPLPVTEEVAGTEKPGVLKPVPMPDPKPVNPPSDALKPVPMPSGEPVKPSDGAKPAEESPKEPEAGSEKNPSTWEQDLQDGFKEIKDLKAIGDLTNVEQQLQTINDTIKEFSDATTPDNVDFQVGEMIKNNGLEDIVKYENSEVRIITQ